MRSCYSPLGRLDPKMLRLDLSSRSHYLSQSHQYSDNERKLIAEMNRHERKHYARSTAYQSGDDKHVHWRGSIGEVACWQVAKQGSPESASEQKVLYLAFPHQLALKSDVGDCASW